MTVYISLIKQCEPGAPNAQTRNQIRNVSQEKLVMANGILSGHKEISAGGEKRMCHLSFLFVNNGTVTS